MIPSSTSPACPLDPISGIRMPSSASGTNSPSNTSGVIAPRRSLRHSVVRSHTVLIVTVTSSLPGSAHGPPRARY